MIDYYVDYSAGRRFDIGKNGGIMLYLEYLVCAAIVVVLSIKASDYVDLLDKNTDVSGALLGGILLSAVTSLPELFTSISSTVLLNEPGLCMGNILGSDLFNLVAISVISLFFLNGFVNGRISESYIKVNLIVLFIYIVIELNFVGLLDYKFGIISITSVIIAVAYGFGTRYLASKDSDETNPGPLPVDDNGLSVLQICIRFFFAAVGIIVFSIFVTYLTEDISNELGLGKGLAGAIFLGVATSLPELTSTITLFRIKNYNIAVGNIVGSNLFNFIILTIADLLSKGQGVYMTPDAEIIKLLVFGTIAVIVFIPMLTVKKKFVKGLSAVIITACYFGFLCL